MRLPLGIGAYTRAYAGEPEILLVNRFIEGDPANLLEKYTLLSRPGSTLEKSYGAGPMRGNYTLKNLFESSLFSVSGSALYRLAEEDSAVTPISGFLNQDGLVKMTGVSGAGYQHLFVADGQSLQYYAGRAYEQTLTLTPGGIADGAIIVVDNVNYRWSNAVSAGDGSGGNPYKVLIGASNATALQNMRDAISATGIDGVTYSAGLVENARVLGNANTGLTLTVRARLGGEPDPSITVSLNGTATAQGLAWGASVLVAGPHVLYGVPTPDDIGILAVATLKSFVLCVAANSQRVYFILPGETTIDPLNFFEAESEPDRVLDVIVVGDQAWLLGQSSTEPWYASGDPAAPFLPVQGRPFSHGVLQGTAVKLADSVFLVADDGIVYRLQGGPEQISDPGIAEKIRLAKEAERANA